MRRTEQFPGLPRHDAPDRSVGRSDQTGRLLAGTLGDVTGSDGKAEAWHGRMAGWWQGSAAGEYCGLVVGWKKRTYHRASMGDNRPLKPGASSLAWSHEQRARRVGGAKVRGCSGGRARGFRLVSCHGWTDAELWSDAACAMCAFASRNSASAGSSRKSAVASTLFFSLGQPRRPVLPCAVTTTAPEPVQRSRSRGPWVE